MVDTTKKGEDHPMEEANPADSPAPSASAQLANILVLIEKAVKAKDTKILVSRLMRQTAAIRTRLDPELLTTFIEEALPAEHSTRMTLVKYLQQVLWKLRSIFGQKMQ